MHGVGFVFLDRMSPAFRIGGTAEYANQSDLICSADITGDAGIEI
jgi:hypothetical protein